jgi:hypothetical protein
VTLRELGARFLKRGTAMADKHHGRTLADGTVQWGGFPVTCHYEVDSIAEADGVSFLCPKCFAANGGTVGTHTVICWFEGRVPDDAKPSPGRWTPAGAGIDDLTFAPGEKIKAVSVQLLGGCAWHGYVANGSAA